MDTKDILDRLELIDMGDAQNEHKSVSDLQYDPQMEQFADWRQARQHWFDNGSYGFAYTNDE